MEEKIGTLILAGGKSERIDFPKIYLDINGKTFLSKIAQEYLDSGINNVCLVINKKFCEGIWKENFEKIKHFFVAIEKTEPELGRFHSIKIGIKRLLVFDYNFIQNVDNPYINKKIINNLIQNKCSFGYTQPFYEGRKGHPILVSKKIIHRIDSLQGNEYDLRNILAEFPKTDVKINDNRILANINTKEDYANYFLRQE